MPSPPAPPTPPAPALPPERGERLERPVYKREFREREEAVRDRDSWKLERRQHFEEQGDPSRDALRRGEWDEALRLLEEEREDLVTMVREEQQRGTVFRRVRVVAEPLTPYMQWQLHWLRLGAECGEPVRVVRPEQVATAEVAGPLPEVVVLGGRTLYEVRYTDEGLPDGAVRHLDAVTVERWERYLGGLYEIGEDIAAYFERAVAPLSPPVLERR